MKQFRYPQFCALARAAEIVGLSQRTIQLWIEVGAIRAIYLGRRYKVCLDSLRTYLRSQADRAAE